MRFIDELFNRFLSCCDNSDGNTNRRDMIGYPFNDYRSGPDDGAVADRDSRNQDRARADMTKTAHSHSAA